MQRLLKSLTSFVVALMVCVGLCVTTGAPEVLAVASSDGYYASITATGGDELLGQLHDLITTTHSFYTSYTDCKNPSYVKRTDPGPNGQLMEFYSQAELSSNWQSGNVGTWNREHVWCQSLSNGLWGENGGGSDLLHIRPTESRLNSTRSNNKYGVVGTASTEAWYKDASGRQVALGGHIKGNIFEPIDSVKGDVARIVMYVYTHYNTYSNVYGTTNGKGSSGYFGTLRFLNVISASNESAAIDLLLEWNKLDPVAEVELARNEAAYDIQGNRNPFVDHPEYADAIWGDEDISGGDGQQNAETFRKAVEKVISASSLEARFQAISKAVAVYNSLTDTDKQSVAEEVSELRAAVDKYNEEVRAYNAAADSAEAAAVGASRPLMN